MTDPQTPPDAPPDDFPPEDPTSDDTHAPPPEPTRRLTRRSYDRVLCGVASGLGDYFNVDPAIFRLAFIALTFFGGSGVVLYVLGWLFLPDNVTGKSLGDDLLRRVTSTRSPTRWIAIIVAAIIVINMIGATDGGVFWAVVLIAIGVFIFRRDESPAATDTVDQPPAVSPSPMPPPPPVTTPTAPMVPPRHARAPTTFDDWRPTPITEPPEPPPPPSVLGRITVAAALILGGLVALIQTVTSLHVSVDQYAALGLAIVGAGLLIGARLGRSRGLIVLGGILVIVMATASAIPTVSTTATTGQQIFAPTSVAELRDRYELGAGDMTLDLSGLELERGQQVTVGASVGIGQLTVDVPPDMTVDVEAAGKVAELVAFDREFEGTNVTLDHIWRGPEGAPTIALDLAVGMGVIEVQQSAPTAAPSEGATTDPAVEPSEAA
jgi:phage shock protein PspC (stress-responsive transcriptional regulator)